MMDDEQKLVWFLEQWYEKRITEQIKGMYQHLSFFLIASSFLLTAYAVVGSQWRGCHIQAGILSIVGGTGLLLSLAFYASNSWNCRIIWEYSRWLQGKTSNRECKPCSPMWLWGIGTVPSLGTGARQFIEAYETQCKCDWSSLASALFDIRPAAKAGLMTRMIPAVFAVTWTSILFLMLRVSASWWVVVFGTVFLVCVVRDRFVQLRQSAKVDAQHK
jgi:hypothetical protein